MTIRRGGGALVSRNDLEENALDLAFPDLNSSDGEDSDSGQDQDKEHWLTNELQRRQELGSQLPPVHPVLTDFGPESLAEFLRQEIAKLKSDGQASKSKSKTKTAELNDVSNKPVKRGAVAYADNALRHLRGLIDSPIESTLQFPALVEAADPPQQPKSTKSPSRRSQRQQSFWCTGIETLSPAGTRASDFQDHAGSVRSRNRPSAGGNSSANSLQAEDEADDSSTRARKTVGSLSHLVSSRPTTPNAGYRHVRSSRRGQETPSPMRAMFTASSQLSLADNDDSSNIHDVPNPVPDQNVRYRESNTNASDLSLNDALEHSHRHSQRTYLKWMKKSMLAESHPRIPNPDLTRLSDFDFAQVVPDSAPYSFAAEKSASSRPVTRSSGWTPRAPAGPSANSGQRKSTKKPRSSDPMVVSRLSYDIWELVSEYLSANDIRRLRLVNRGFAAEIAPIMFRSVVTRFGPSMFHLGAWKGGDIQAPLKSVLAMRGKHIHKFAISFDYDAVGLAFAKPKSISRQENAWYGSYRWPLEKYPRFVPLQELEDLVDDNRPLLKNAFRDLTAVSELGLSLDSGHGWLEATDVSDLAVFEARRKQGGKMFGESFSEDIWHTHGRNEYFRWAQQNSINEIGELISARNTSTSLRDQIKELGAIEIRDYASFEDETGQPDFDPNSHVGGQTITGPATQQLQNPHAGLGFPAEGFAATVHQIQTPGNARRTRNLFVRSPARRSASGRSRVAKVPSVLQYPLIFNCFNIAADTGGCDLINSKIADPAQFPLIPGHLTEAQVQWLTETLWAQRAFLSAYTTAAITNRATLQRVHSLTIAKISSGLLPSLAQREFWTSLGGLKRLKILVKPDWRGEHIPGDKFHARNMPVNPCLAAGKFAEFLEQYVARLEHLSHLTIGYYGGGEHAAGMFARNTHILPAPITNQPWKWISDHKKKKPDPLTMFTFPHIRDLTFENCWVSPCMLETFMNKSRDTSLHTLVLDSVSMLAKHATDLEMPLSTVRDNLRCQFDIDNWLAESIPASATWTEVLNNITPGITMLERKYAAGMLDVDLDPIPTREFRGNITKIVLKSCGYAKISATGEQFNQNALVVQAPGAIPLRAAAGQGNQNPPLHMALAMAHATAATGNGTITDSGLVARKMRFCNVDLSFLGANGTNTGQNTTNTDNALGTAYVPGTANAPVGHARRRSRNNNLHDAAVISSASQVKQNIMMPTSAPDGTEYQGLGTLTQCIHPIEKRILEQAWGMKFGWGSTMKRWGAVEDGWLEGGTGRFSGVVGIDLENKSQKQQEDGSGCEE